MTPGSGGESLTVAQRPPDLTDTPTPRAATASLAFHFCLSSGPATSGAASSAVVTG